MWLGSLWTLSIFWSVLFHDLSYVCMQILFVIIMSHKLQSWFNFRTLVCLKSFIWGAFSTLSSAVFKTNASFKKSKTWQRYLDHNKLTNWSRKLRMPNLFLNDTKDFYNPEHKEILESGQITWKNDLKIKA